MNVDYNCTFCSVLYPSEPLVIHHVSYVHRVEQAKYAEDNPHYTLFQERKQSERFVAQK